MDARTQAWIDQEAARLTATIRRHGWSIQYVGGSTCSRSGCGCSSNDEPAFAYTIGLFAWDHPELLIFGVPPETAAGVCNDLGELNRAGTALLGGRLTEFDEWAHRIAPEMVLNPGDIVLTANRYYRRRLSPRYLSCNSATTTSGQVPVGGRVCSARNAAKTGDVQGLRRWPGQPRSPIQGTCAMTSIRPHKRPRST